MSSKHLFALFSPQVPAHVNTGNIITFIDADAWHRLTQVLRLTSGDQVIVFNNTLQTHVILDPHTFSNKKNIISALVVAKEELTPFIPAINIVVGLTKREAFEDIAYSCSQMGVTNIRPIFANRTHRNWLTEKELPRLHKIMIAACEQAKQFVTPTLHLPETLSDILATPMKNALVCSPDGLALLNTLQTLECEKPPALTIFIGPEGGFDESEGDMLTNANLQSLALGKSILRTQDAVQVIVGSIRALRFN